MTWDAMVTAAASKFTDCFGESVVYRPRTGAARTIRAIVDRQSYAAIPGLSQGIGPNVTVHVLNSATLGISSTELDTGGDKMDVALRLGKTAETRVIARLVGHDAGMLDLELA